MRIFEMTKNFPSEERFSMVDQMRRSSRAVCSNIGEAWRKRRSNHFVSKLSDSEGEAEETRVWLEPASRCGYSSREVMNELDSTYDGILAELVHIIDHAEQWTIRTTKRSDRR